MTLKVEFNRFMVLDLNQMITCCSQVEVRVNDAAVRIFADVA